MSAASVSLLVLGMILNDVARADVAPGPGPLRRPVQQGGTITRVLPTVSHPLTIRVDRSQAKSRILIPRACLTGAAAPEAASPAAAAPSAAVPGPDLRSRAIVAGCALSLLLTGGFLTLAFARQRRRSLAAVATTAALAGVLLLVGTAMADLLPPGARDPSGYPSSGRRPQAPSPEIVIETVTDGNEVVLILGRDAVEAIR
jgi:hypothetical protein